MIRSWTFLLFFTLVTSVSQADECNTNYCDEESGIQTMSGGGETTAPEPVAEPEPEPPGLERSLRPLVRPRRTGPVEGSVVRTEPTVPTPTIPGVGTPTPLNPNSELMLRYNVRHRKDSCGGKKWANEAPIWPQFIHTYSSCEPTCAPGINNTFGCRPGNPSSCHPYKGRAIDLNFIECAGVKHSAGSPRFGDLVKCMKKERYNGPGQAKKSHWEGIYRQTSGKCSHITQAYFEKEMKKKVRDRDRRITECHWDHAHFDLGC